MKLSVTPVPKPRMTKSDAWRQRPPVLRYFAFKDELRLVWGNKIVPDTFHIIFYVPMPKSWSTKKRLAMNGTPHQQRPDVDNFLKSFLDALCEEDSYVWDVRSTKVWATAPGIEVLKLK